MAQRIRTALFVLIGVVGLYFVLVIVSKGGGMRQVIMVPMGGMVMVWIVHRVTRPFITPPESLANRPMGCAAYVINQYGYPIVFIIFVWLILARAWETTPPATGTNQEFVSRASMGADWPLTVESGVLMCLKSRAIVFETAGQRYAVNGAAEESTDHLPIASIWATDGSNGEQQKDIRPLAERGLALCD